MGKVSRSAFLSGAFHVRWPTIYNARYLSSFAYRLSGEHLSIIKRRYLSLDIRGLRSILYRRGSPRAVTRRRISGEKSVTRILHELPTRYWSRHSRGVRDRYSRVRFSTWTGLSTRLWSFSADRDDFPRSSRSSKTVVCGLLKNFTESSNKAEWRRGNIEHSRTMKRWKKGEREEEKDGQK